jgi:hypothetical protein
MTIDATDVQSLQVMEHDIGIAVSDAYITHCATKSSAVFPQVRNRKRLRVQMAS